MSLSKPQDFRRKLRIVNAERSKRITFAVLVADYVVRQHGMTLEDIYMHLWTLLTWDLMVRAVHENTDQRNQPVHLWGNHDDWEERADIE